MRILNAQDLSKVAYVAYAVMEADNWLGGKLAVVSVADTSDIGEIVALFGEQLWCVVPIQRMVVSEGFHTGIIEAIFTAYPDLETVDVEYFTFFKGSLLEADEEE